MSLSSNLLFLNFGKLIEGRSKHHYVKPQRFKEELNREMKKDQKLLASFSIFCCLVLCDFLLPVPSDFEKYSEKVKWNKSLKKSRIQRDETILKRWHWLHLFLYRTGAVVDLLVSLPFFAGCSDCHRWLAARLSGGLARNMCLFFLLNWDVISPKPWADIVSRHIWRLTFVVTNSTAPSTAAAAHNNPLGRLVLALYDTFVKIYQIVWNFYFLLI